MDEQIRAAAAEALTREIEAALKGEHRFELPRDWRDTIRRVAVEHIVVVVEEPASDPEATTKRIVRDEVVFDTDELDEAYPRPEPHGGVKHKG